MLWLLANSHRTTSWRRAAASLVLAAAALVGLAQAQEKKASGDPLLVITVASVERLLQDADYMFEAAGRPELSETLGAGLAQVRDLKGIDRDQSVGLMLFLNGLTPQTVGFVPVSNIDDLLNTVTFGPITTAKTGDDTYEVRGTRPDQTMYLKLFGKYAYVSNDKTVFDRDLKDPAAWTNRLAAKYDFAISASVKNISPTTKQIFLDFTRGGAEAALQQRDDEPDAAYRVRKAAGDANLELLEMLVNHGEELTIGWNVSKADRHAIFDVTLTVNPKSPLASRLDNMRGVKSRFAGLLKESVPLTISGAGKLDKTMQGVLREALSVGETRVQEELASKGAGSESNRAAVVDLFAALRNTAEAGQVDFFAQFRGEKVGELVLVGGAHVADGARLNTAVATLLDVAKASPDLKSVQIKAAEHRGVALHRVQGNKVGENDEKLYGQAPALFFGAGTDVLWFAVGGDGALPALKKVMDKAAEPGADQSAVVPFQIVSHMQSWLDLLPDRAQANEIRTAAAEAFQQGDDVLRIDIRPIDDGVRFRVEFEEGFVRLVGKRVAKEMDERAQ